MPLDFGRRLVWLAAGVIPIPTALYAVHTPNSLAWSYLSFNVLGWLLPTIWILFAPSFGGWRQSVVYTATWICRYAFAWGFIMVAFPWSETMWTMYGPWICVPLFAGALVLQLSICGGLSHLLLHWRSYLSGRKRRWLDLFFVLALVPNLVPLLYVLAVVMGESWLQIHIGTWQDVGITLAWLFVLSLSAEVLLAALAYPAVYYINRDEAKSIRAAAAIGGTLTCLGAHFLGDYIISTWGLSYSLATSVIYLAVVALLLSILDLTLGFMVAEWILQRKGKIVTEG